MALADLVAKMNSAAALSDEDAESAFAAIMDGEAAHEDIKAFLEASIAHMRQSAFIAAGARALRARMLAIRAPEDAIDVCGTGGDGAHTLNISTAVAFVVAGAGVPVAKHGNRAMSSQSGAADVLEALGVKLTGDAASLERCLAEAGLVFLFAQNHHPAMRHVAAARREMGKRTIFNLLGPLANPAKARRQLIGVFAPEFALPMAEAARALGAERAWGVHGAGGLDELAPANGNVVMELSAHSIAPRPITFVGQDAFSIADLRGGLAAENAEALLKLLKGDAPNEAYRQIVTLNAAAALAIAGQPADFGQASLIARESLEEGLALDALERLIDVTRSAP